MTLIELLKKLEQDYNHPWPNEDEETKKHRINTLRYIQFYIEKNTL